MKITRTETEAIVTLEYNRNNELRTKEENELKNKPATIKEAKRIHKIMESIPKKVRDRIRISSYDSSLKRIIECLVDTIPLKTKQLNQQELRTKIILTARDCKDMQSLLKKLNIKTH